MLQTSNRVFLVFCSEAPTTVGLSIICQGEKKELFTALKFPLQPPHGKSISLSIFLPLYRSHNVCLKLFFLKIKVLLYGHELMRRFENVYLRRDKKCQKERRKKRVALQLYFWIMSIKLLTILWKVQGCTSIVKTNETIWLFFFCEWKEDRLLVELNKVISWKGFMGEICLKSSSQVKINIGVEVCWQKLIENEIGN